MTDERDCFACCSSSVESIFRRGWSSVKIGKDDGNDVEREGKNRHDGRESIFCA